MTAEVRPFEFLEKNVIAETETHWFDLTMVLSYYKRVTRTF